MNWLKRLFQKPAAPVARSLADTIRFLRGRYDAALSTDNNRRHWAGADGYSVNTANNSDVRRLLRNRSRYEVANNSYAKGIVLTLANDVVGTGPRLQMLLENPEANRRIESAFTQWARVIRLPEKLRTLRMARAQDGEGFGMLINNPLLPFPLQLDLRLVEADQVTTPDVVIDRTNIVDGIVFDEIENPIEYYVLTHHPGDLQSGLDQDYERVPAELMIHYVRRDRPGQMRGIPDITPALPLFAMLRDYSLATLDAAKAAAYFAGIIYTDAPPNGEADAVEPMDHIELERNMLLTMPGGWKLGQIRAEQPTGSYGEFKREILNEIARCLNMPYNVAAANSSGYNYASGRLDHQTYFKSIRVEQAHLEAAVLDRLLMTWFEEVTRVPALLPGELGRSLRKQRIAELSHQWFWDGHEHVDPAKEANAQATRLSSHTTTLADEYARRGQDWETQLRQRAKEKTLMTELGLDGPESRGESPEQEDEHADENQTADAA
ncbi:MAG: phage portal protein [Phycisphaerae bacterium]